MSRQFRLVHIGVTAALAAATVTAVGLIREVGAAASVTPSSFVPIVPCRLADTRAGSDHVGVRPNAIGGGEAAGFAVWGTNGNCTIPTSATGIATNVTAVNATAPSYMTLYPVDAAPRPTASNLNYGPASPPTPNEVTVGLSATGAVAAYNLAGSVDVIIDIVGYYQPAAAGVPGAKGDKGDKGDAGTSLGAYGSFSNDGGPVIAVILGGTSIPLSTTTASLNISYSGTTATLLSAGVYRMSYCVRTTTTHFMSSRLLVNGAGVTSSAISPPQGSDKFCRATTLSLVAGTTINLQLYANPPVAAALLSPGGAELLIEKLGQLVP